MSIIIIIIIIIVIIIIIISSMIININIIIIIIINVDMLVVALFCIKQGLLSAGYITILLSGALGCCSGVLCARALSCPGLGASPSLGRIELDSRLAENFDAQSFRMGGGLLTAPCFAQGTDFRDVYCSRYCIL